MKVTVEKMALDTLEVHKKLVWEEIKKYLTSPEFPIAFKVPSRYKFLEKFHWEIAMDYPERRGKYLRPTLLMLTAKAMGGKKKDILKTAAAMQISEDWILVHDDIEDDSLMRRGKPTLHKIYGIEQGINAGDSLHAIMWKILFDNLKLLGSEKTAAIFNEFYSIMMRTTLGQTVDIKWFRENNYLY